MSAPWAIERVTSSGQLEDVLRLESQSFTNPWTLDMYLREMEHPDRAFIFVARDDDGRAVGFCSVWQVVDELHFNNLAVDPSVRRRGVARALIGHVYDEARQRGARRATLEVRRSNVVAQQLYEALGFRVSGVRRDYYTSPVEDALILWCDRLGGDPS